MLNQISIQAVHYTLSDTATEFIQEKLSKLDFLHNLITDGSFRVIRDNEHYKVEADIHLKTKVRLHINTTDAQLYPAIENVIHKLKHKLAEEHKKVKDHHKNHAPSLHHSDGQPLIDALTEAETPSSDSKE